LRIVDEEAGHLPAIREHADEGIIATVGKFEAKEPERSP
jgi:hypothetical protein